MNTMQMVPISLDLRSEGGLANYIRVANAAPVLTAEQERELALRYREHQDLDAARQLVLSQLRYVIRVARGFAGYGLPQADLIQEGNIGLMKAVKHYDPLRGVRLVSFAVHWIKAEMYEFILQNWRLVKVATTKAQRKLFFNLRKHRSRLGWMTSDEVDSLAENLDVDRDTVLAMEARMGHTDTPFDADDSDKETGMLAPAGYIEDMRYNPERVVADADDEANRATRIQSALAGLDPRSRDIVQRRWLDDEKPTLHDLADEYGVSAERIRQIEKKALASMREVLVA